MKLHSKFTLDSKLVDFKTRLTYLHRFYFQCSFLLMTKLSDLDILKNLFIFSLQVAISFHNMKHVDQAVCYFKRLLEIDPYRLVG